MTGISTREVRASARFPFDEQAHVTHEAGSAVARCLNISRDGLAFTTDATLRVGSQVVFALRTLDGELPLNVTGEVVRGRPGVGGVGEYGVRFSSVSSQSREAFVRLLAETLGGATAARIADATEPTDGFYTVELTELVSRVGSRAGDGLTQRVGALWRPRWPDLAVAAGLASCVAIAVAAGVFDDVEQRTVDARLRGAPPRDLHASIRVLEVDDITAAKLGWPIPHGTLARVFDILAEAKALGVATETQVTREDSKGPEATRTLGAAIARNPCVVLAVATDRQVEASVDLTGFEQGLLPGIEVERPLRAGAVAWPVAAVRGTNTRAAHIEGLPGLDGVHRSVPLWMEAGGRGIPALGLAAYLCSRPGASGVRRDGATVRVRTQDGVTRVLSIDETGNTPLAFRTRVPSAQAESLVRFLERHDAATTEGRRPEFLGPYRDTIVMVTQTATMAGRFGSTPLQAWGPLGHLQVELLDTLLTGDRLVLMGRGAAAVVTLVVLLLVGVAASVRRLRVAILCGAVGLVLYGVLAMVSFRAELLAVPLAAPGFGGVSCFALVAAFSRRRRDRRERNLRQAFGRRLSPTVLERIVADPQPFELDGHRRALSVMFVDIKGFARLLARRDAADVLEALRRCLDRVSGVGLEYGGFIERVTGDGLVAVFGDPVPSATYAQDAARAAFAVHAALRAATGEPAGDDFEVRVAIATGEAFAGNLGGAERLDYAVLGAPLTLALRLAAACPPGGVLVCRDTAAKLAADFVCGESEPLTVRGMSEPYRGYYVTGPRERPTF